MKFSVWNQGARLYDYFEDGRAETSANVDKPGHLTSRKLGTTPQQAAWPLPAMAKKTGSGERAVGRIASRGGRGLGELDEGNLKLVKAGVLLVVAGLLWRYAVPRRRRR